MTASGLFMYFLKRNDQPQTLPSCPITPLPPPIYRNTHLMETDEPIIKYNSKHSFSQRPVNFLYIESHPL